MNSVANLDIKSFAVITKALSDQHRVRALLALRRGELCVCQLIDLFALAPSTVSKHMSILKQAGLVDSRKDSRWVYYRLVEKSDKTQGHAKIIQLAMTLLEHDEQIGGDDKKMAEIGTGCDMQPKKKRSIAGIPKRKSL